MSQKQALYQRLDPHQIQQQTYQDNLDAVRVFQVGGTLPFSYDYVSLALSNANTTETYTFKTGGSGGITVGSVVINYTNSTRDVMSDATITQV